jgi:hypothetical protein
MIDEVKIMQYADGTLPIEEHEEVKKAIEADPKLKELYNSFQETGDLLFKLSNEIKSKPLPQNLQDKADIIKIWKKPVTSEFGSFNFFGLFKIQYAGVAAACCLMFVGGMYADTFISGTSTTNSNQVTAMNQKIDAPKDLKFRGMPSAEEDLSTRVTNLYRYFNADQFLQDINSKLDTLEINDEFDSFLEDNDGKKVKFILVENFNANGNGCKKVRFNEPLKLSNIDQGTDVSLDICKVDNNYEISSINLSK